MAWGVVQTSVVTPDPAWISTVADPKLCHQLAGLDSRLSLQRILELADTAGPNRPRAVDLLVRRTDKPITLEWIREKGR